MKTSAILAGLIVGVMLLTSGCGLIPKKVELFQDKVHKVPQASEKQKELQREAAQKAHERASETLQAALDTQASPFVVVPARDTEKLTEVVAESVGPAAKPTQNLETSNVVNELRAKIANLSLKMDSFTKENNENAGKKIEGTGLIQVPYIAWGGGFLVIVFVGWHLAKTALTVASAANPGAAVGVGSMNVAGSLAGKGFTQVVAGGKSFLEWAEKELDPVVSKKVVDAFTTAHEKAQDSDVQSVVKNLIK